MDSFTNNLAISVAIWLICNWSRTLCCRHSVIIILLFFNAIPSIAAMSSGKGQYSCSSFKTSALVDGHP